MQEIKINLHSNLYKAIQMSNEKTVEIPSVPINSMKVGKTLQHSYFIIFGSRLERTPHRKAINIMVVSIALVITYAN